MGSADHSITKEKSLLFEAILSSPGMQEKCKLSLSLSRQNILLLCRLIEADLFSENGTTDDPVLVALSKDSLAEIREVHEEILKKGGLSDFYQKLKFLQ